MKQFPYYGKHWIFLRALRISIICVFTFWLVRTLHIPYGEWAVLSVLVVSHLRFGASVKKGLHRILGTVTGCLAGALLGTYFIHYHFDFIDTLPIWVFLAWYLSIISYAWVMFFGMILLTCVMYVAPTPGTSIDQLLFYRAINIILGVSIALISEFLFPQKQNLHDMLQHIHDNWKLLSDLIKNIGEQLSFKQLDCSALNHQLKDIAEQQLQGRPLVTLVAHEPMYFGKMNTQLSAALDQQRHALDILSNFLLLISLNHYSDQQKELLRNGFRLIESNIKNNPCMAGSMYEMSSMKIEQDLFCRLDEAMRVA